MDAAQRLLFGRFPRAVGTPRQHMVHSESEMDFFIGKVNGKRNAYSTISWFPIGGDLLCDKVSFDLDSPLKATAFPADTPDDEKIVEMRKDDEMAQAVLETVCEDVRKLANASAVRDIPAMGVFSGFGVHFHQLYQPKEDPEKEIGSTVKKFTRELELQTVDRAVIGDTQRIMRIPNMKRVHADIKQHGDGRIEFLETRECPVYTVPLRRDEMREITPSELMELSQAPRRDFHLRERERPQMEFYEGHYGTKYTESVEPVYDGESRPIETNEMETEEVERVLKELVPMPCMYERIIGRSPAHHVRLNTAVLLFNIGFSPVEVADLYQKLRWEDYDRSVTLYHLKHIYRKGYSDMNCESIQRLKLCTRTEEPMKCETYGWCGGEPEWQK